MADNIYDAFEEILKTEVPVNLNADIPLTDEQIREKNKKYVEEVLEKVSKEGVKITPEAVAEYELSIAQRRQGMINEIGTAKQDNKDYPRLMKDPINLKNVLQEDVKVELNFKKNYDPNDFFIKARLTDEQIQDVQKQIANRFDAPFQVVDGKRHYHTFYYNQEAWCVELFFEAMDWDAKIVEAVMNEKNTALLADIAGVGFATLAYWARGKK